jgi:uncharacterized protein DUF1353
MGFDNPRVLVEAVDGRRWALLRPLTYTGDPFGYEHDRYTVPRGYITDLTSSPRVTHFIAPVAGKHSATSVLHDWLITHGIPAGLINSIDTDGLFRRSLKDQGIPPIKRWIWWTGVRWGALGSRARRPGWWRTAPQVLACTLLLCVPFVVIPAVVNGLFLVLYGVAELIASRGRSWGTWRT